MQRDSPPVPRDDLRSIGHGAPCRLDHVNLRATDIQAFHHFAIGVPGMKLSDRTTGFGRVWLRA